jgi:hypothetical protein
MPIANTFRAVYCSGLLVPNQATMAALGLLFEKVYLPNNIEFLIDFARRYRIDAPTDAYKGFRLRAGSPDTKNPLEDLSPLEQETFFKYVDWCMDFAARNYELFGPVVESTAFGKSGPLEAKLIKKGRLGELNTYEVSRVPPKLVGEDMEGFDSLIESGYVPVVGNLHGSELMQAARGRTAKELAALLAIQSVEMLFPATRPVPAAVILEARAKLHDQLSLFWAAMFRLSVELKSAIKDCKTSEEIAAAGTELVDTIVRPAITELSHKIELERKQWFRRLFGSVYRALKITAANPPITQDQLIRTALLVGTDATMNLSEHLHKVEAIKRQAGLTYLLDLSALVDQIEPVRRNDS